MKIKFILLYILVFLASSIYPAYLYGSPLTEGNELPDMELTIPKNQGHQQYLGLTGEGTFKVPQIKAKVVIIEILSMYCPHCQREAPTINEFYRKIENSKKLKGKVKLIGIGAGNSSFEMGVFQKKYDVPFPLFPDGDFLIHQKIGEVRTPYFIALKITDKGKAIIFYSQLGGPKNAQQFLNRLLKRSGL
ncbi:MAG: redoxin domain-containing protein [Thermodesulfobacteriota bacterium]|nr:redoxin domain-containing protein [Thermodesulfobacteriota bacterium]